MNRNSPTVELDHTHITTLRAVTDQRDIERELSRVHRRYLQGHYSTEEEGRASVDDLRLDATQLHSLRMALSLSDDVHEYLQRSLDSYQRVVVTGDWDGHAADAHIIGATIMHSPTTRAAQQSADTRGARR